MPRSPTREPFVEGNLQPSNTSTAGSIALNQPEAVQGRSSSWKEVKPVIEPENSSQRPTELSISSEDEASKEIRIKNLDSGKEYTVLKVHLTAPSGAPDSIIHLAMYSSMQLSFLAVNAARNTRWGLQLACACFISCTTYRECCTLLHL